MFQQEEEVEWALQMIKDLIKYNPNDRKSVDDVLKSKYFQPEPYVIYDNPSSPSPGLCVILSQEKFHNVMKFYTFMMKMFKFILNTI